MNPTAEKLSVSVRGYLRRVMGNVIDVDCKPIHLVSQGVGTHFEQFYDRSWQPHELKQTRLVFIGRSLNPSVIESQLVSLPS